MKRGNEIGIDARTHRTGRFVPLEATSLKMRSSPSASAWRLVGVEPGTTIARTPAATLRHGPAAAAREDRRDGYSCTSQ
jgi:hypothetical protein